MYLAYFDESGDDGLVGSPTTWFVLSGVLVHDVDWLDTLDKLIDLRRSLKATHGIPSRAELKGTHFKRGRGALSGLGITKHQRWTIYESVLDYVATLPVDVFGVAIHKANARTRGWLPRTAAWTMALQRINTFCRKLPGVNERAIIVPDAGHGTFIRRQLRSLRRHNSIRGYFGGQTLNVPTNLIVEDPNDRDSHHSYFVQVADLTAFAAHRSKHVHPTSKVPRSLWDRLDPVLLKAVNALRGGPPGIVRYP